MQTTTERHGARVADDALDAGMSGQPSDERIASLPERRADVDMAPRFVRVLERSEETRDVVTFDVGVPPELESACRFLPGQFNMLYAFGVGEVPLGISGDAARTERLTHTVRAVGPVSRALAALRAGDMVGLRGPFGNGWPLAAAEGHDVLICAGGSGLIPLRPLVYHLLRHRGRYGRVVLLYGARRREDLLFQRELAVWRRHPELELRVSLNEADRGWTGGVGFVTQFLPGLALSAVDTVAMLCGPEIMLRATGRALVDLGVGPARVHASMERNMKCALGTCGHCQLGPLFLCRDGPVFTLERIDPLMSVAEL